MSKEQTQRPFTGKHMLIIVLLFFGTIFSVNIFMATKAVQSWTGLVVKNSYVASQQFNEKLAASRAQAELNLKIDLTYSDGVLKFFLADQNNVAIELEEVKIALTRPIGIALDRSFTLLPVDAWYQVEEELPAGVWNVVIHAQVPNQPDFNYRARLIVAPPPIPGT
ncbi:MAG: FixH family protein [Devosiaceae bacterium]|nr:FixH family protein [Devosiaceae bacterium]